MFVQLKNIIRKFGIEYFQRYYSLYRGSVVDVDDPENLGRIKVKVPQIYGDNILNYWAYPVTPFAGNKIGSFFIPNVDDFVYIQFEGGDIRFPVYTGFWWGSGQVPDGASKDVKIIKTNTALIKIDDAASTILITDSAGNEIFFEGNKITIKANDTIIDSNSVKLGGSLAINPAVKGIELENLLNAIVSACAAINVAGLNNGQNAITFNAILPTVAAIKSNIVKLE